jgi:hypothetical protein
MRKPIQIKFEDLKGEDGDGTLRNSDESPVHEWIKVHTDPDKCMHFYPYSQGEGNVVSPSKIVKIDYLWTMVVILFS